MNKKFTIFCYGIALILAIPFLLILFSPVITFIASLIVMGSIDQAMVLMMIITIILMVAISGGAEIFNILLLLASVSAGCSMAVALMPAFAEYRQNKNPQS